MSSLRKFIQSWLINTLAVLVAVYLLPGIHYQNWEDLFIASLLLGVFNAILRPVLLFLALPLVIVTLGLFMFVINAFLLYAVGLLLQPGFVVGSFWAAFLGALVISVVSVILNTLTGTGSSRISVRRRCRPPDDEGQGPTIDI